MTMIYAPRPGDVQEYAILKIYYECETCGAQHGRLRPKSRREAVAQLQAGSAEHAKRCDGILMWHEERS